jgi:hypothetical protein
VKADDKPIPTETNEFRDAPGSVVDICRVAWVKREWFE